MKSVTKYVKTETVDLRDLLKYRLIGFLIEQKKYMVSFNFRGALPVVTISNGCFLWQSYDTVLEMIEDISRDPRVSLFYFDTLQDLAEWLKEA